MGTEQLKRLKEPEKENARLKRVVPDSSGEVWRGSAPPKATVNEA
jgi:hypothetical protein